MRILIEPSDYVLRNVGDMAMLKAALSRLAATWPDAMIEVLSDEPQALRAFCPHATPLDAAGRHQWLADAFLPGARHAPHLSRMLEACVRRHAPALVETLWRRKLDGQPRAMEALAGFTNAVARADLVMVTGMGGITDAFADYAANVLETLRLALRHRKYVAMVGQGFGPLKNPDLVARARSVLPHVDFIGLREERAGRPLLTSLGVPENRIMTTGDDATEIAYDLRQNTVGSGLGINLRASDYSAVDRALFAPLRAVLRNAKDRLQAPLIPVPISFVPGEADMETIRMLTDDEAGAVPGCNPEAVIRQIQRCRLLVTGSYHAGVFALACGIPVIGLARAPYYVDKFQGLAALYGEGCQVVLLDDPDFARALEAEIARLWGAAEAMRPPLLAEAARQIRLGQDAYRRIRAEFSTRS